MTQYGFFVDVSKCTGCKTCMVACKDGHFAQPGMNLRKVREYSGGTWRKTNEGAWKQDVFAYYVSLSCNHCSDPACVKVCPTGAHFKRKEDGLVVIDTKKCIGCGMCAKACPYDAPVLDAQAKKMRKCDGCLDRLSQLKAPLCVEACPQRAIAFGPIDELRKQYGKVDAVAPLPEPSTKPNLVLRLPKRGSQPVGSTQGTVY